MATDHFRADTDKSFLHMGDDRMLRLGRDACVHAMPSGALMTHQPGKSGFMFTFRDASLDIAWGEMDRTYIDLNAVIRRLARIRPLRGETRAWHRWLAQIELRFLARIVQLRKS